jgi:hypothetical protein
MVLFSDSTKAVVKAVVAQATGTVVGGAVFQLGVNLGNTVWNSGRAFVASVTGDSK